MIKFIAIVLGALSLTACITVEVPPPEYSESADVVDAVGETDTSETSYEATVVKNVERNTPRPSATVHPAKRRPDMTQILIVGDSPISNESMFEIFQSNFHLAEKAFNDKWIWFSIARVERVERNRLLLYTNSDERQLYARFPSNAGLEDVRDYVIGLLCFDPTYTERNDVQTITVSDCEIIEDPLAQDE